ncbi:oligosaccharide flippase family protein [Calditerricola satsumensis]|uniref:oligosaccharide flippase family protein n=1 Tax=Calditerricola satsumensis TaxID=373054 RepID=UPI00166AB389|nr:oligosaccharide flippase family protein [Calditerricola satsumensis]
MSLRTKVLQGGFYLALRQGLGMLIGVGGVLVLTRTIGPQAYGIYAGVLGVYAYLHSLSQWGIGVYLIRREGEIKEEAYHQAFTFLLVLGGMFTVLAWFAAPLLESWVRLPTFTSVARTVFLGLLLNLLSLPALARLERGLQYRQVAMIELLGQITFYLIALPLAFSGFGMWAPVAGWWAQQTFICGLYYRASRYRPRLYWNHNLFREMVGYGLSYSASIWVWQLRTLVNPVIVGRFGGAEMVGYVALTIRMVETLSFVKSATWRLSIAVLAKLQGDVKRLTQAITEGMQLQILALGPILVVFGWAAPWLVPLLFGPQWLPVLEVYPFIALSYLANAMFNLHSSALYVLRYNLDVTAFHIVHIVFFAGSAYLLVPRLGLVGYGWAEVVALLSYAIIHWYVLKRVYAPSYRKAGKWFFAFVLALFSPVLGWTCNLAMVALMLWPGTWREFQIYIRMVRGIASS